MVHVWKRIEEIYISASTERKLKDSGQYSRVSKMVLISRKMKIIGFRTNRRITLFVMYQCDKFASNFARDCTVSNIPCSTNEKFLG